MDVESQQKGVFKDDKTQKELNKPLTDPTGASDEDKEFLNFVVQMIDDKKIDIYNPETLLNHEVYDKLSDEQKGKTDFEAVNLLAAIREIKDLHDQGDDDSYQMQNLVHRVRSTKERLEEAGGDIFII